MLALTLGEGNTPLVPSVRIGAELGLRRLFFKLENCNPCGSYKDRFVAGEIRNVLQQRKRLCVATSSGNTGSSLSAYCARAGLPCVIVVNSSVPGGKLIQMQAHGASVLLLEDFVTSARVTEAVFAELLQATSEGEVALVVSAYRYCPAGMSEVEVIASEINRQSPVEIQHVFVPVGGGGLFTAICRGFARCAGPRPRVHAVQPAGCATVVGAFERGESSARSVDSTTRISGLSVPYDIDATLALDHLRRFGGLAFDVTDEDVLDAQKALLEQEGIYAEPAGAASLAGLRRGTVQGAIGSTEPVVCLVTGHGFKDAASVERVAALHPTVGIRVTELRDRIGRAIQCESR